MVFWSISLALHLAMDPTPNAIASPVVDTTPPTTALPAVDTVSSTAIWHYTTSICTYCMSQNSLQIFMKLSFVASNIEIRCS